MGMLRTFRRIRGKLDRYSFGVMFFRIHIIRLDSIVTKATNNQRFTFSVITNDSKPVLSVHILKTQLSKIHIHIRQCISVFEVGGIQKTFHLTFCVHVSLNMEIPERKKLLLWDCVWNSSTELINIKSLQRSMQLWKQNANLKHWQIFYPRYY
jgi:hypothetical protein